MTVASFYWGFFSPYPWRVEGHSCGCLLDSDTFSLVTIRLFSSFSNLILTAGRVDMNHLSPSRLCLSLLIVPVFCVIWLPKTSAPLCRMSIVSAALGVITLWCTAKKCFLHHWGRHAMDALCLDVSSTAYVRKRAAGSAALLPLQGSSRWGSRDHGA